MKIIFFKNISKEIVVYSFIYSQKIYLLLLSNLQGFGLIQLISNFFLINHKKCYIYNFLKYNKSYTSSLISFFLGFYKNYLYYLKIKGMGFKVVIIKTNLLLKLGYTHRSIYLYKKDIRLNYLNKHLLQLESRSISYLKNLIYNFTKIYKLIVYKKKGIFLKGVILKFKVSSKKIKV